MNKRAVKHPLLGAHMSIAGGLHKAFDHGEKTGCEVIQIFSKSPNQWAAKAISAADRRRFLEKAEQSPVAAVAVHDAYLINLASPDAALRRRSRLALSAEVKRAARLKIPYLVIHPGSHGGRGEEFGILQVAEGLNSIFEKDPDLPVRVLLETTAGQGNAVGYRFEHLRRIIDCTRRKNRVGVCFDTCHVFAAGYDLRSKRGFNRVFREFEGILGLETLHLFHLNDSKKGAGKRVDRHTHIGKGALGKEPFRSLLEDDRFEKIPMILETPKEERGEYWDKRNLAVLKRMRDKKGNRGRRKDLKQP